MKKIFLMLMLVCCVFVTGCFGKDNNSALKDIRKKYENLKAYQLTGNLEILNNDDVYNYDDPDDFADDWAEEFDGGNYDGGYDDAYDYWEENYGN